MASPFDQQGGCGSHRLDQVFKPMFSKEAALAANLNRFAFALFVAGSKNTFIPSGTWKFASKDRLVVFTLPESIEKIEEIFC